MIKPNIADGRLWSSMVVTDEHGIEQSYKFINERPLTIFLNSQEVITAMSINDYPNYLALGYLYNQNMLYHSDDVTAIDYDDDIETIVIRTKRSTNYEEKMQKKIRTSGCAQGTIFGDILDNLTPLHHIKTTLKRRYIYELSKIINNTDSLYLQAGAIHGACLCQHNKPLIYMEDVGRHNAVDKVAGFMYNHAISSYDKIFYTTGRLTSEMVIKTVNMGIPILISRSGFTAWGVELAHQYGITLIGRAKGKRMQIATHAWRIEGLDDDA